MRGYSISLYISSNELSLSTFRRNARDAMLNFEATSPTAVEDDESEEQQDLQRLLSLRSRLLFHPAAIVISITPTQVTKLSSRLIASVESTMIFLSIMRFTLGLSMMSGVENSVSRRGPTPRGWSFHTRYMFRPERRMVTQNESQCESSTDDADAVLPIKTLSSTGHDHRPNIAGT